jgi:hypothetical protein
MALFWTGTLRKSKVEKRDFSPLFLESVNRQAGMNPSSQPLIFVGLGVHSPLR